MDWKVKNETPTGRTISGCGTSMPATRNSGCRLASKKSVYLKNANPPRFTPIPSSSQGRCARRLGAPAPCAAPRR